MMKKLCQLCRKTKSFWKLVIMNDEILKFVKYIYIEIVPFLKINKFWKEIKQFYRIFKVNSINLLK